MNFRLMAVAVVALGATAGRADVPEGADVVVGEEGRAAPFKTEKAYGDVQVHLEWQLRDERARKLAGNYRYNTRINFPGAGSVFVCDANGTSGRTPWVNAMPADSVAGAVLFQNPPAVNTTRGYGEWNSMDIVYRAAQWEGTNLVRQAEVTVFQNGVLVQDHWGMEGDPNWAYRGKPTKPKAAKQPISFERGTAVFRNVWVREI